MASHKHWVERISILPRNLLDNWMWYGQAEAGGLPQVRGWPQLCSNILSQNQTSREKLTQALVEQGCQYPLALGADVSRPPPRTQPGALCSENIHIGGRVFSFAYHFPGNMQTHPTNIL